MPKPKSGDVNNMTREEIDMVAEFLIEKKKQGQFRVIWESWSQLIDLHTSGEIWLSDAWQPATLECQRRGTPIHYAYIWEGTCGWAHVVGIPKNAPEGGYQRAMDYINWWQDGPPAPMIAPNGYLLITTNDRAKMYMDEAGYKKWYLGQQRDLGPLDRQLMGIGWWDKWPENLKYLTKRWQQFLAA